MQTTTLTAPDIVCDGCATSIKKALGRLTGISEVEVDVATKGVRIIHEPSVPRETLVAALERAGFPST